jgi:hypothetical protein
MTYLRELIDRLGKALGFTSRTPQAASADTVVAPAGLATEPPESET